eukprot:9083697-Heterocapsa_arctica.AAC.1
MAAGAAPPEHTRLLRQSKSTSKSNIEIEIEIKHRHRHRTSKFQGVQGHRGELSPSPLDS